MREDRWTTASLRAEFVRVGGGMTTAAFARHCLDEGIFAEEEREAFELRAAQHIVRKALHGDDASGLPFAGPTRELDPFTGSPLWVRRDLWSYEDYAVNVDELRTQRDTMHWRAVRLAEECRARYGRAPRVGFPVDPIGRGDKAAD